MLFQQIEEAPRGIGAPVGAGLSSSARVIQGDFAIGTCFGRPVPCTWNRVPPPFGVSIPLPTIHGRQPFEPSGLPHRQGAISAQEMQPAGLNARKYAGARYAPALVPPLRPSVASHSSYRRRLMIHFPPPGDFSAGIMPSSSIR